MKSNDYSPKYSVCILYDLIKQYILPVENCRGHTIDFTGIVLC